MTILGVHLTAIALAGAAAWIAGALWYGLLGRAWVAALGTTREALMGPSGKPGISPFLFAYLADCVIALTIGIGVGALTAGHPSIAAGLIVGVLLWGGCVFTTIAVNNGFARRSTRLTLID
ncbi:MAG TPA: DUF1761 domain-containing protein, partial [Acetobacteraceae bacterium]|nr:DUF1761 domain-containing protein [Acetobacteraceae bacterium]